ncbi:hypothetical protein JCM8547_001950 [Rhodosporidiobolus lusitaniae]
MHFPLKSVAFAAASSLFFPTTTAHPSLLSPLSSMLSSSPISALQTGFAQYQPLLSPSVFAVLAGRLAILPARATSLTGPLQKAFLATGLAISEADKATLIDAQACLTEILARGTMPDGYACVDDAKNTVRRYRTAGNTVLEQFIGIVPPATLNIIQDKLDSYFDSLGLIPPVYDLKTHVQNAVRSVVSSTSGETVTSIERLQDCLVAATASSNGLQQNYKCFVDPEGSLGNLENIFYGVLQQFVGYLQPNIMQDVINIYSYYLSAEGAVPGYALLKSIDLSLLSITASTSGNSVTAVMQLTQCFNDLIMEPNDAARAGYTCLVGASGPLMTTQVLINGIVQQGFGYLPPTLILNTEQALRPLLSSTSPPTQALVSTAFSIAFRASDAGPETTTCFLALEDCVNAGFLMGSKAECNLEGKCSALLHKRKRRWGRA